MVYPDSTTAAVSATQQPAKLVTNADNLEDLWRTLENYVGEAMDNYQEKLIGQVPGPMFHVGGSMSTHSEGSAAQPQPHPDSYHDYKPPLPLLTPAPPREIPSPSVLPGSYTTVPATTAFAGQYGFEVSPEPPTDDAKSTSWTYSPLVKKLYAQMAASCPVRFRTAFPPPLESYIRATAVFVKPEHAQEVVQRCPHHRIIPDGHHAPDHIVRCDNQMSQYVQDPYSQRLSVVLPWEPPSPGCDWLTNLFRFMCFSSCVGSLNRRQVQIVFTLEKENMVLGRQSLEVRICASPGRDRRVDEKALSTRQKGLRKRPIGNIILPASAAKRQRTESGDNEIFTLTVSCKEHYKTLVQMRDALELMALLPTNQIQAYKDQQLQLEKELFDQPESGSKSCNKGNAEKGKFNKKEKCTIDSKVKS